MIPRFEFQPRHQGCKMNSRILLVEDEPGALHGFLTNLLPAAGEQRGCTR